MKKSCKIFIAVLGVILLFTAAAGAVSDSYEEDIPVPDSLSTQVAYTVTIVIGILLALILVWIARENSEIKGKLSQIKKTSGAVVDQEILRELQNLAGPSQKQRETALVISSLLQERINQKINTTTQELTDQYTKVVEERTQEAILSQQKFEKTLKEKKQTEAIVRSVAEGVVVVNDKGEVLLMNPAAERLLDINKEKKIGRPLLEDVKEGQMFSVAKGSAESGERDIELNSTADETKKVLRSSSAVIEDENGKTVGMVTVLSDITKQRELERMKSEFVSGVSHELRNPIGAIQQSIAVILDRTAGPLTEHQEKFLTNAQRNLKRLSALIDDLLDLAKLEARRMELTYEPSSLGKITDEVYETMETWAKNKEIKLIKKIPADLPQISIDPNRIIQVLVNLVGNAIKFTPNGGSITIEAKLIEDNNRMEVRVADTGIGISPDDLKKLFNKFQQVGKKRPAEGGTGLGLVIVKEIVQLHGGEIHVESEPEKGSQFIFTLPLTKNNV